MTIIATAAAAAVRVAGLLAVAGMDGAVSLQRICFLM
jgi:hypothetical protein